MKRSGFKRKEGVYSSFKKKPTTPLKRTKLRVAGQSEPAQLKRDIQSVLRKIVIARDKGCFLRHYENRITPQYRECGGYRKDGELILQAEHLHTRSNAASFSDSRLVVCCCQRHHIFYKAQHSAEYNKLAREYIGVECAKLWDRVAEDHRPHKVDLKLELLALNKELKLYEQ